MPAVSSSILGDANLLNLRSISQNEIRPEVPRLMMDGEQIIQAFKTVRDQVIFTDRRIFVVNVQGITGKKISYFTYPYSKVIYYGIETAGVLDVDSELVLAFANGAKLQFDFQTTVDIRRLSQVISHYIL
ncbi:MAG: PH domain-containing protein [Solobacterium sp.]|nr:PH domain-containing protein [Solobacterium sp.]